MSNYAYDVDRPDHFQNIRLASEQNFMGMTAVVNNKPYLVIDREKVEYVLENEDGEKLWLEHFDHTARNEQDALIAASRVNKPFVKGSQIGDWTIGNLVFHEGNGHVRNGETDQIVPIPELVQMLEDENWFKDAFSRNFTPELTRRERRAKEASLKKVAVTIETNLPKHGWHNGAIFLANQMGLNGTITYPDGDTLDVKDQANFFKLMTIPRQLGLGLDQLNEIPITVETDNPDLFGQIWEDTAGRGGGGGNREQVTSSTFVLPDTPSEHSLDAMATRPIKADRRDYEHWNEDADYMWWEEEGKHQDGADESDYDDEMGARYDAMMEEAAEEGYQAALEGVTPDTLDVPYRDSEAIKAFLNGYQDGRLEMGTDLLTPEEYDSYLNGGDLPGRDESPWLDSYSSEKGSNWTRQAELIQDIPYVETGDEVVHGYPDGDVVLMDGRTTFDPNRAYSWLIGQKEFDKAQQVKELIDRSPPPQLPDAVIPPEEATSPNTEIPETNPDEAPLDPTGGQPESQTGAPVQPGTQIPPIPMAQQRPSASKEARKNYTLSEQKDLINENPKGRARNYDKLNLKGTHYEIEQEASLIDDFLGQ